MFDRDDDYLDELREQLREAEFQREVDAEVERILQRSYGVPLSTLLHAEATEFNGDPSFLNLLAGLGPLGGTDSNA